MPIEANSRFPPNLRDEIGRESVPFYVAHYVLGFSADQYKVVKAQTERIIERLLDNASEKFLKAQNRIIFEQQMEKSQSIIAERSLELARDQIID